MGITKQILAVFVIAAITGLFACTKSKSSSTAPGGTGKPFYCKLAGTGFAPSGGARYFVLSSPATGIQIVGDNADTTIEIHLSSADVGTYSLGGSSGANFGSVYYTSVGAASVSTSGEVKITKSDGSKISGTFSYTAAGAGGNIAVTAGEFNDIPKQ